MYVYTIHIKLHFFFLAFIDDILKIWIAYKFLVYPIDEKGFLSI